MNTGWIVPSRLQSRVGAEHGLVDIVEHPLGNVLGRVDAETVDADLLDHPLGMLRINRPVAFSTTGSPASGLAVLKL